MEELEDEGGGCFSGGWDEVDGIGLDFSGRRLRDVGGQADEDAIGGHVDGCDEGMDVGQEDGLERLFFFLLWWMDVSDQLFLFPVGAEKTGSEVLVHVFFKQVDHMLGDGIQTVFQDGGELSGSMLLPESIFLSHGPDFAEEVFLIRDAVPEGLLQDAGGLLGNVDREDSSDNAGRVAAFQKRTVGGETPMTDAAAEQGRHAGDAIRVVDLTAALQDLPVFRRYDGGVGVFEFFVFPLLAQNHGAFVFFVCEITGKSPVIPFMAGLLSPGMAAGPATDEVIIVGDEGALLVEAAGDLREGAARQVPAVDLPQDIRGRFVDLPVVSVLGIAEEPVQRDHTGALTGVVSMAVAIFLPAGQIPGVPVADHIKQGDGEVVLVLTGIHLVEDRDKPHVVCREELFQVEAGFPVVAAEAGQVPYDDGIHFALLD